jgi:transmembrane 9 superfamily member 3
VDHSSLSCSQRPCIVSALCLKGNQSHGLCCSCAADVPKKTICTLPLGQSEVAAFSNAVRKHYWYGSAAYALCSSPDRGLPCSHLSPCTFCWRRYELFIDDLPVWGFVGPPPEETKDDDNIYIYTHKQLEVAFNDNRVGEH